MLLCLGGGGGVIKEEGSNNWSKMKQIQQLCLRDCLPACNQLLFLTCCVRSVSGQHHRPGEKHAVEAEVKKEVHEENEERGTSEEEQQIQEEMWAAGVVFLAVYLMHSVLRLCVCADRNSAIPECVFYIYIIYLLKSFVSLCSCFLPT